MISLDAPAKVNLRLAVGPIDAEGLHPVDSVVQTISVADVVEVEVADQDNVVVAGDVAVPAGPDNLALRALTALRHHGDVPPLAVHLTKRVPTEAGLGGGSADAAAVLRAAATLAGVDVDLRVPAAGVGSDVPALVVGGTVAVSGTGERADPMAPVTGVRWLVATPPFGLPTGDVYARWDALGGPRGPAIDWPATSRAIGGPPRNDLQPAAIDLEPSLTRWLEALGDVTGRPAMVSGSGSTCFVEADRDVLDVARAHPVLADARLLAVVDPVGPTPLHR